MLRDAGAGYEVGSGAEPAEPNACNKILANESWTQACVTIKPVPIVLDTSACVRLAVCLMKTSRIFRCTHKCTCSAPFTIRAFRERQTNQAGSGAGEDAADDARLFGETRIAGRNSSVVVATAGNVNCAIHRRAATPAIRDSRSDQIKVSAFAGDGSIGNCESNRKQAEIESAKTDRVAGCGRTKIRNENAGNWRRQNAGQFAGHGGGFREAVNRYIRCRRACRRHIDRRPVGQKERHETLAVWYGWSANGSRTNGPAECAASSSATSSFATCCSDS